ncbi:MAG: SsrA-binding protein SmpB [Bdellovibrionaceae bacterium]|nr:SsrA-binding protein SmpB [Pseudobdellovibrionaceae bacterium]MDW8189816.1 SsrA-binding protein SmpB [Pseudobdellovibrionaceae bacterium]
MILSENRKARHDYQILKCFEAGLVLLGSEVKSIRQRKVQLRDSYIAEKRGELYWYKGHIDQYQASSYNNHEPDRPRKLLLHKSEIHDILGALEKKGQTCVPLKIYLKNGKIKMEIALVRGKTHSDKRQDDAKKSARREMERALKR